MISLAAATDVPGTIEGYQQFEVAGTRVVARAWAADALRQALSRRTLQAWAADQPDRDVMHGRGACYGVTLTTGNTAEPEVPVVVRRNRHGGLLRFFTREYFLAPTRAPLELANSARLTAAGVPTPEIIAYALYPSFAGLVRCDVMTRRLPKGGDLPELWTAADPSRREAMLEAVAVLLRSLTACGAWHPDLNLKNIYLSQSARPVAYLLDVDRVLFRPSENVATPNFQRLSRSARKWRMHRGLEFDEAALARLAALAQEKM